MFTAENEMIKAQRIILVGAKHCGKTSAGSALQNIIKVAFIDIDKKIEEVYKKTVREIYKEGAEVFRAAEAECLKNIFTNTDSPIIISTGGGIIDNEAAKTIITGTPAVVVYLEISAETAYKRILQNSKKTGSLPPFLECDDPQAAHKKLHDDRACRYKEWADITINAEAKTQNEIALEIKGNLWI
ncbi:MAG: shikimate kinase [Termitinemataceae bacterium]|nr:MAG: shikimate kinase [Termitinemataceae bacterium]